MKPSIGHIILSVSNLDTSEQFYDALMEVVGFEVGLCEKNENSGIKEYASEGHSLMILSEPTIEHKKFVRYPGLNHIALRVGSREAVDKAYKVIKTLGTTITREPRDYPEYGEKYYAFFFRDPDGIPLEVAIY